MEREEISTGLVLRCSFRQITAKLGRVLSTISHEVNRNGGAKKYRAADADEKTWQRALRPKPCRLSMLMEHRGRYGDGVRLVAHVNRPGAARKDQAACTAPGAYAAPEGPTRRTLCTSWCVELHHFLACAGGGPHCGDCASETCGASCAMKGIELMQTSRCSTTHKITGKPCG
ncbi:Helix-turn-helix domain-containing protein [Nitrosospira sp. Nsp11]|nr:Helix-turn-helix domain-containing protein [Nitrosospira sp. Nsp11]